MAKKELETIFHLIFCLIKPYFCQPRKETVNVKNSKIFKISRTFACYGRIESQGLSIAIAVVVATLRQSVFASVGDMAAIDVDSNKVTTDFIIFGHPTALIRSPQTTYTFRIAFTLCIVDFYRRLAGFYSPRTVAFSDGCDRRPITAFSIFLAVASSFLLPYPWNYHSVHLRNEISIRIALIRKTIRLCQT